MTKTWTYWSDVAKMAAKESGGEIAKRFLGFAILLVAAALLGFFFGPLIGMDRLLIAGLAILGPVAIFLWKLVAIPARLHERQISRKQIEDVARKLDALWEQGRLLYDDGYAVRLIPPWDAKFAKWKQDILALLERYDRSERFMFDTIDYENRTRAELLPDSLEGHEEDMLGLIKKMEKLRNIIGRAYARGGMQPSDEVPSV